MNANYVLDGKGVTVKMDNALRNTDLVYYCFTCGCELIRINATITKHGVVRDVHFRHKRKNTECETITKRRYNSVDEIKNDRMKENAKIFNELHGKYLNNTITKEELEVYEALGSAYFSDLYVEALTRKLLTVHIRETDMLKVCDRAPSMYGSRFDKIAVACGYKTKLEMDIFMDILKNAGAKIVPDTYKGYDYMKVCGAVLNEEGKRRWNEHRAEIKNIR
jgi:hypothetical protein